VSDELRRANNDNMGTLFDFLLGPQVPVSLLLILVEIYRARLDASAVNQHVRQLHNVLDKFVS
jgi:hypothetical protein